jgi:hypothetical protein
LVGNATCFGLTEDIHFNNWNLGTDCTIPAIESPIGIEEVSTLLAPKEIKKGRFVKRIF